MPKVLSLITLLVISCTLPCFSSKLSAQENRVEYDILSSMDTGKVLGLLRNAELLLEKEPGHAKIFIEQAMRKSQEMGYPDGIAKALILLSQILIKDGDYKSGLQLLEKAGFFAKKSYFSKEDLPLIYHSIAFIHYNSADLRQSIANSQKALEEFNKRNLTDSTLLFKIYLGLSAPYVRLSDSAQALHFLNKAESLAGYLHNDKALAKIYNNKAAVMLASYYRSFGPEPTKRDDLKDRRLINAIEFYQLALRKGDNGSLQGLGFVYLRMGQGEKAFDYFEKAFSLGKNTLPDSIMYYVRTGEALHRQGQNEKALSFLKTGYALAQKNNNASEMLGSARVLSGTYGAMGSYKEAWEAEKQHYKLYSSIMDTTTIENLNQLKLRYQSAEKEKQFALAQMSISKQRKELAEKNAQMFAISGGALILIIIAFSLYRNNRHNRKLQREQIRVMEQEREIGQLKASMKGEEKERARIARELHDGFVSQLSAIKMNFNSFPDRYPNLALAKEYKENLDYLDDTIKELRKTAHNLMPEILLQSGLAEAVQVFSERISKAHRLQIDFQLYGFIPRLAPDFELALYRMVQELLQNIIKHSHATKAIVQLSGTEELLTLTIEDNGIGFPVLLENAADGNDGMGLRNLKARVHALNGYVNITSENNSGTTVYFEFDLNRINKLNGHAYQDSNNG